VDAIFTRIVSVMIIGDYMIRSATHLTIVQLVTAENPTAGGESEGISTDGTTDTRFVTVNQPGYYYL